ncbi:PTS sugar transporter subunit IIA [Tichowtungia aerotolerans]|uniref:PTS transporter subunit EIIA n=1 Tax=Tichowtungia aerotolerans TaxID=2697043 RepID=A0A6P1MCB2_9BACT|nr:PTS sugar transporter subunit IIA [Tichowtungia aerotolerans]QHI69236.1 PTS transporter subunit EIIA [Tichowtungia aerotolerans]
MVRKEHHIVKHLIQLQDLLAARAQQQAAQPKKKLEQLDKNIKVLADELSPDLRSNFMRLVQKNVEALAPVTGENCSGCGFALTKALVNNIHGGSAELSRCPNCTRILYAPDVPLTRRSPRRRWGDPVKRGVERFSAPELMLHKLKGTTGEEVLWEICENMQSEGYVEDCDALHEAALHREAIISTAMGGGMAFPHVRGVEGGGLTLSIGVSKKGIDFGGSTKTKIFFYMVIPTAASAFYLKLLAGLTQSFSTAAEREPLLKAKSQEDLWNALIKGTRKMVR